MSTQEELSPAREHEIWHELEDAVAAENLADTRAILEGLEGEDQTRAISRLSQENREALVKTLPSKDIAKLLKELPEAQAVELIEELPAADMAPALVRLPPETGNLLIRELDDDDSKRILDEIGKTKRSRDLRAALNYPESSAGCLMRGRPVSFLETITVQDILEDLREHAEDYSDRDIQYLYVVDDQERLTGVLQLRNILLSPADTQLRNLMIPEPLAVRDDTDLEELDELFKTKPYLGFPVIDSEDRLVGVIPRDTVQRETSDKQTEIFLQSQGIVDGEELRSMPLFDRCRKRLAWLAPNIVLNLAAASVIAANEATLQEVIALAVFLPIVSDMSGCSGNQAVAVSIRELTLGVLRPRDFMRVVVKEGFVGIINGILLGLLLGTVAALWKGNVVLGAVVAVSLALNTVLSVLLGGLVPLFLKSRKVDPALASGPILTTCTDMCGFFLVLSFASAVLDKLT